MTPKVKTQALAVHSPTPWRIEEGREIIGGNNRYTATVRDFSAVACGSSYQTVNDALRAEADANAALIVQAVNSHAALVSLVSRALDRFTDNDMIPHNAALAAWTKEALATLKLAGEEI